MLVPVQTKVRDVKYCRDTLRLATLGTDGVIKFWDPNLSILQTVSASQVAQTTPFYLLHCHHNLLQPSTQQQY